MKVNELAKELELPTSVVLEQCLRLGIDATWAGSELSATELVVLRAELANEEQAAVADKAPAAEVAAEPPVEPSPDAGDGPVEPELESVGAGVVTGAAAASSGAVPPTAVGSLPDMTDELMDAAKHGAADPMDRRFAGSVNANRPPSVATDRGKGGLPNGGKRRYDAALRPGIIAVVLAIAFVVGANSLDEPALIVLLWIGALVGVIIGLISGNKARYRITTHPEQRRGLPLAIVLMVVSVLGIIGLGAAAFSVVRSPTADDAPLGLGTYNSITQTRWGYLRVTNIADTSWERPAKDAGTCWALTSTKDEPRRAERVEFGGAQVDCDSPHAFQVLATHSVNNDADAAYPGAASLKKTALIRCQPEIDKLKRPPAGMRVVVEYPTSDGWNDGDHDVSCVAFVSRDVPLDD